MYSCSQLFLEKYTKIYYLLVLSVKNANRVGLFLTGLRRQGGALPEIALPQADIVPTVKLEADLPVQALMHESHCLVQRDLITHHFSRRTREEAVRGDVGSRTAIVAGRV
jgi:hypothetical protein